MCNAVFRTPFSRCPLDGTKLAQLDGDPLVGTVLDKRYVIEECIGEGGMGRVYRAKHTRMSRHYAIKILFGDHAGDTRMRSRFAREAEAVSRLSHANVISVVDFGETEEGLLYLVMDLADGESLAELVHREAPLGGSRAIDILARLGKGLAHAHSNGLVHRDFKCENVIMVTEEGVEVPKIVDFGICMIVEDAPAATMLTSNGMIMGTPAVMAPEQASGDIVDNRTDLFSLGIVGYQMLSGGLPFEGTPLEMARKNLYEEIPRILDRSGVHVDPGLEAIVHKLTAKNPDQRYQDAKEFLEALRNLDMAASFDSWTNATPLPGSRRGSGPTTAPTARPGTNGPDRTAAVNPLHVEAAPIPTPYERAEKRKKGMIVFAVFASLAILLLVGALATSGGDSKNNPEGAELAAGNLVGDAGVEGARADPNLPENPEQPGTDPIEPSAAQTDASVELAVETKDAGIEMVADAHVVKQPKNQETANQKRKRLALERKPRAKRQAEERRVTKERNAAAALRNKPPGNSKADAAAQLRSRAVKLYDQITTDLDVLEKLRGPKSAARFRARFKSYQRTKLLLDTGYAKKETGALYKLKMDIKQRKKLR